MKILEFAFQSFWHFIGALILFYTVTYFSVNGVLRLCTRFFRLVMVLSRGWPPDHLDADGDFHKQPFTEIDPIKNANS